MASIKTFRCFYINLDSSTDRRAEMEAELHAAGVEAERVPAFDGRKGYAPDDVAYRPGLRRLIGAPLSGGEVGCSESHRRALRRLVETGAPFGVILEDDAALSPRFRQMVEAVIASAAGWDMVRLEWRKRGVLADAGVGLPGGYSLVVPSNMTFGSTAALYTRRGALQALRSLDNGYVQTIDAHYGSLAGLGFGYFQLSPPVVTEKAGPSLISTREISGGADRESSRRNRLQLQMFGIYRAWLSVWRRVSGQVNAGRLRRLSGRMRGGRASCNVAPNWELDQTMSQVIRVVTLWVREGQEAALEAFEREAARIMARYGGRIDQAIRLAQPEGARAGEAPFEVHVVSFPDKAAYEAYSADSETMTLRSRRDQIISRTVVAEGHPIGPY